MGSDRAVGSVQAQQLVVWGQGGCMVSREGVCRSELEQRTQPLKGEESKALK